MSVSSGRGLKRMTWIHWLPVMVFALVVLANLPFYGSPDLAERGDQAANGLQIERAKSASEYLGPYSRFQFNHPGPVTFYYLALTERLFFFVPTPLSRHLLAQLVLNLLWIAALVRVGSRLGLSPPVRVLLWFAVPVQMIAMAGGTPLLLGSIWGPLVVVLPVTVFACCAALIADGDLDLLPLALLAAVFAIHNHVGTIAVIGPLALVAFGSLIWMRRRSAAPVVNVGRTVVISIGIVLLAVLPAVYEEVTVADGNLSDMATFVGKGAGEVHDWGEVTRKLGHALTDPLLCYLSGTPLARHGITEVLVLLGLLAVGSGLQFRRSDRRMRLLILFLWLGLICAVVSGRFTRGKLMPYLFFYVYGLIAVVFVVCAQMVWDLVERMRPNAPGYLRSASSWALLGLVFLLVWIPTHRIAPPGPRDDYASLCASFDLPDHRDIHLVVIKDKQDGGLWREATGIALSLVRDDVRVTVPDEWVFMYGEAMRRVAGSSPAMLVLTRREAPPDHPAACDLGDYRAVFSGEAGATAEDMLSGFNSGE